MTSKTVTSGKVHIPSPRMHNFEDAKIQGKKTATRVRSGRDVNVSDEEQHSLEEPSATNGKQPKMPKTESMANTKYGHFRKHTGGAPSKDGPKRKHTSKKSPHRNYYKPSEDTGHSRSTNKVTSSVQKTPNSSTSPMTRANCQAAGKHQSTMNQVQYHTRLWRN